MSTEPSEQWQAGYQAALEREPARLYLEGPGAAQLARLLTAEAAIARLTDLCDESRSIVRTAEIRAVLDAVSVDATPTQGIDRDALMEAFRFMPEEYRAPATDWVLALVRPVEGDLVRLPSAPVRLRPDFETLLDLLGKWWIDQHGQAPNLGDLAERIVEAAEETPHPRKLDRRDVSDCIWFHTRAPRAQCDAAADAVLALATRLEASA